MKIDAHQHFWNPARGDYCWMPEDNKILYRSYLQNDLEPYLRKLEIDKTILVQAAPSIEEPSIFWG